MSSELAPRSSYLTTGLGRAEVFQVQEVAARSRMISEITAVADHEVARVGAHTIGTMAELVQGAGDVRYKLLQGGHRSDLYDDAQSKILQVTGQNLITLANTAQQEIMHNAAYHMR